jgi:predicted transcriptional regulator
MTRTLHVTIGETPDRSDLEATLGAIDSGEEVEPQDPKLSIENLETFGRIFRPTNLELLEAIVEHDPESLRELARIVDRHPPEVHSNVHELVDYGLVQLEDAGQSKRPVVSYDEIEAEIPLASTKSEGRAHSAP